MRLAACFAVAFTILMCCVGCAPQRKQADWLDMAQTGVPFDNRDKMLAVNWK